MYTLIETLGHGAGITAAYASLYEATDALIERASSHARRPGTRVVTQRPRSIVLAGGGGARIALALRHAPGA